MLNQKENTSIIRFITRVRCHFYWIFYTINGARIRTRQLDFYVLRERKSYLVKADDVVVSEHFQYLDFTVEFTQVAFVQLALVHNLDRHL